MGIKDQSARRVNTARIGVRIEHEARDCLIGAGFLVVRAAASKGPADLLAIPRPLDCGDGDKLPQSPWLVQCKRAKTLPIREATALRALAAAFCCKPVGFFHPRGFGKGWFVDLDSLKPLELMA